MQPGLSNQPVDRHLPEHWQHQCRPGVPTWILVFNPDLVRIVLDARLHLLKSVGLLADMDEPTEHDRSSLQESYRASAADLAASPRLLSSGKVQ
jgi:hypothetical protein